MHAESVFRVDGLCCGEEAAILERRLRPVSGVEAVTADIVGQRLRVTYDAAVISTNVIVEAVGDTGMRAWLEHEEPAVEPATRTRGLLVLTAGTALAGGLAFEALAGPSIWSLAAFVTAAVAGGIFPGRRALASLRSRVLDINVLMLIAVAGAMLLGEWAEAGTVVCLFAIAQWLESRSMERARDAIRSLMDLSPAEARIRAGDREEMVAVDRVALGAVMSIRPGEKIPLDGVVAAGRSDVNQAPITGESLPAEKGPGDEIFAGTINGHGALEVTVTRKGRDTTLARIIHLVETAQAQRAPAQQFIDRFARWYTPAVIVLAVLTATVPVLAGGALETWFYRALVLLVVACPCALVISTPVSIVSALAGAARRGVLVKGGIHLERLAVDPCHRLRQDRHADAGLAARDGGPAGGRSHPGPAAGDGGGRRGEVGAPGRRRDCRGGARARSAIRVWRPTSGRCPGLAPRAMSPVRTSLCGNPRLYAERGLGVDARSARPSTRSRPPARPPSWWRADGALVGVIGVADEVREVAADTIELLHRQGIRPVVMLTGDQEHTARALAVAARGR